MGTQVTEELPRQGTLPRTGETPAAREKAGRLMSLDAYRGFIMLAMASGGLALARVGRQFPDSPLWQWLAFHTDHVPWVGCSFWDLIQPSFMFMVGVALPYSYWSRKGRGESEARIWAHAVWRALVLVALGIFLSSNWGKQTNFTFVNVLTQIGLGYVFLYFLIGRGAGVQLGVLALLLGGYWLAFLLYPLPGPAFDTARVGVPHDWPEQLSGWFAHWNKNTNAAAAFDLWFLNLFPRPEPFVFNNGGYQTLNFLPSLGTMILGLVAGERLRRDDSPRSKLGYLVLAGLACLAAGWLLGLWACPLVKRIWTPSWAVYSSGWTFLMLAFFFLVIEIGGWRTWAFPLVVVGANSIAMYVMAQLMKPWVARTLEIHLGPRPFAGVYGPIVQSAAVLLVLWLICLWLYRRKIFIRI